MDFELFRNWTVFLNDNKRKCNSHMVCHFLYNVNGFVCFGGLRNTGIVVGIEWTLERWNQWITWESFVIMSIYYFYYFWFGQIIFGLVCTIKTLQDLLTARLFWPSMTAWAKLVLCPVPFGGKAPLSFDFWASIWCCL